MMSAVPSERRVRQRVLRLNARAGLADAAPEIRRARAQAVRGEAPWQERLDRFQRGDALIVALRVAVVTEDPRGRVRSLPYCNEAVWIDRPTAPSDLEHRLRDIARQTFRTVGAGLRDRGVPLAAAPDAIAVDVTIEPPLVENLSRPRRSARRGRGPAIGPPVLTSLRGPALDGT
jgi:hypothetical protein